MAAHALGAAVSAADDEGPDGEPEPRFLMAAGVVLHVVLAAAGLLWLWWRDRLGALPERAVGERGPWLGSAAGLGVGLLGAQLMAWASRRQAKMRELEASARFVFQKASDSAAIVFVLVGAIAEELFFRLAVLDVFGLLGSVAVSVVVNSSIAGWPWLPLALVHALALGLLVQNGFGLLGSTTASAVMNYLNLRRIQCR